MRLLLDTNIYGRLIVDPDRPALLEKLALQTIYGCSVIRKELRKIPVTKRIGKQNLRIALLNIYDALIRRRDILVTPAAIDLATAYSYAYKASGGHCGNDSMWNDFLIVACAVLNSLDIVASNDTRTMLSSSAMAAYTFVSSQRQQKTPQFLSYDTVKRWL